MNAHKRLQKRIVNSFNKHIKPGHGVPVASGRPCFRIYYFKDVAYAMSRGQHLLRSWPARLFEGPPLGRHRTQKAVLMFVSRWSSRVDPHSARLLAQFEAIVPAPDPYVLDQTRIRKAFQLEGQQWIDWLATELATGRFIPSSVAAAWLANVENP